MIKIYISTCFDLFWFHSHSYEGFRKKKEEKKKSITHFEQQQIHQHLWIMIFLNKGIKEGNAKKSDLCQTCLFPENFAAYVIIL